MSIMNTFQWQAEATEVPLSQSLCVLKEHSDIVVFFTIGLMKTARAMADELDGRCASDWRSSLQERLELGVKKDADFWPMDPRSETVCYGAVLAGIEEALAATTPKPKR